MRLGWVKPALVTTAIAVAVGVSLGGGGTFVALEVTTQPEFCNSCHIMEPYYESWKSSSHSNVSCVECHYEPGLLETFEGKFKALSQLAKYVTSTEGSKPWAEVSDYSCMRSGCHSTQLLEGELTFGRVRFDHRQHLIGMQRGEKLRCTSCHSQIVQGNHLTVTTSSCILCHFKGAVTGATRPLDDCMTCHGPPTGTLDLGGLSFVHQEYLDRGVACTSCHADVTRGTGEVPPERCGSCHNQQEHLQRIGDVAFMHLNHVTNHSVTCLDCHLEIRHGLPARDEHFQGDCTDCHAGTHDAGSDIYRGTGGVGVPDSPGAMYLARVTCDGCHRPPFRGAPAPAGGATWQADEVACLECHGAGFDGMVGRWQEEARDALESVQAGLDALHGRLQEAAGTDAAAPAQERFDAAAHNVSLVLLDGSEGAHNLPYVRSLLERAAQDARAGWELLPGDGGPPALQASPAVVADGGCTTLCHAGIQRQAIQGAGRFPFDHARHLVAAGLDCSTCHADEPHDAPLPGAATCTSCHHPTDDPQACATCHADVAALRSQPVPGLDALPMADVDCLMCHISMEPGDERSSAHVSCELCHAGEGRDAAAWMHEADGPLAQVEAHLAGATDQAVAVAREVLAGLRRAGPFHNPDFAAAEARRLQELLAPGSTAPQPAPPDPDATPQQEDPP